MYPGASYGPAAQAWRRVARRVRELCEKSGLRDRLRRPILPGDKHERNKRIVEWLADEAYRLELEGGPRARIWAHRKAAWAVEDLEQEIGLVYRSLGRRGLQGIPNIGPEMAQVIENRLAAER